MSEKVIGVYPLFNTGGICVHAIDYFVRLFFRAVLRGHAHVNLKREGLHESDC